MGGWIDNSVLNFRNSPAQGSGLLAEIPPTGPLGMLYISTDTQALYRYDGSGWVLIGGPGTGTITGSGTVGKLAKFTGATVLGDSIVSESGSVLTVAGSITANAFIVTSGTSAQFLKADGSLDATAYIPTAAIGVTVQPYNANTTILGNTTTGTGSIVLNNQPALILPSFTAIQVTGGIASLPTGTGTLLYASTLTGYVPYTGATTTVNLGSQTLLTTGSLAAGRMLVKGVFDRIYEVQDETNTRVGLFGYVESSGSAGIRVSNSITNNSITLADNGNFIYNSTPIIIGSGTVNYLPKFSATSTLANSLIIDNGTIVSVGGELSMGFNNNFVLGGSLYEIRMYRVSSGNLLTYIDDEYDVDNTSIKFRMRTLGTPLDVLTLNSNNTILVGGRLNINNATDSASYSVNIIGGINNTTGNNYFNSTSGNTSIGTTTNTYKLNVAGGIYDSDTQATLNQSKFGVFGGMTFTATGTETAQYINAGVAGGYVMASAGSFTPLAKAKQGAIVGSYYMTAASTVTGIQNCIYANCELASSGTITTLATIRVGQPDQFSGGSAFTGTITNMVGLYIDDISGSSLASKFTNKYGIYQVGTSDKNFLGGELILGSGQVVSASTTNTNTNKIKLTVNGTDYYLLASTSAT